MGLKGRGRKEGFSGEEHIRSVHGGVGWKMESVLDLRNEAQVLDEGL